MEPPDNVPYAISVWSAKSAAFSIGVIMRSTVRKAAKFAVYEEIIIKVKNHQMPPTMRVDVAYEDTIGVKLIYIHIQLMAHLVSYGHAKGCEHWQIECNFIRIQAGHSLQLQNAYRVGRVATDSGATN